ncbi:helix-turn-helix domain-containing protein [Microscilla marina]|uniref:Transcriptional regulator, AraC family protein n=1 Tax=Microscilla marina ATCC 23134 TaxID=313606 RepID=A1ZFK6_MICM2|nr:helix-turn-helix transcriptional regulator [Microscilla marina]EAY30780.1 transcriptional regulator, AraC family protein [Microscilla marina ATCC 23134]
MFETILLIFGAVQGFMVAVMLFTLKQNRSGNSYLALFILVLASQLIMALAGVPNARPPYLLGKVSFESFFLLGPLMYGYVNNITQKRFILSPRLLMHFAPFFFLLLLRVLLYSSLQNSWLATVFVVGERQACLWGLLQLLSVWVYMYLSYRVVQQHQARVTESYTGTYMTRLTWLLKVILATAFVQLLLIIDTKLVLLHYKTWAFLLHPIFIFFILSVLTYWIAYKAYAQPNMFRLMLGEESSPVRVKKEPNKVLRDELSAQESEALKDQLLAMMDNEQPYVDSKLTLTKLAEQLSLTPKVLVAMIEQQFSESFQDFIDRYRVAYAKELLANPSKNHVPITNIGFSAGFNSLKNFQKTFQKATETSPTEYRESAQLE